MIVKPAGNDIRADANIRETRRKCGGQPDCIEAGMDVKADPRPFARRIGADGGQPLILANQRELTIHQR